MKLGLLATLVITFLPGYGADAHHAGLPAEKAMTILLEGNARFVAHKETHPDSSLERRHELIQGQHPYAIIVGCADSRVPPELVFDAGLGDLFVIREAGNVVDDVVLGSIEYGVEHLGVKLVVVLGHESCGAITAAVAHTKEAHITSIMKAIQPAVDASKGQPGDAVHNCVLANAQHVAKQIRSAKPILAKANAHGGMKVVAAIYDIETGKVSLLD